MIGKYDGKTAIYLCAVCGEAFYSSEEAQKCEATTEPLQAQVGQIVLLSRGYGWFDGKPEWVVQNTGTFNGGKTHSFWYVVTAITKGRPGAPPQLLYGDYDAHRWTYHLATRAMVNQSTGGWTRPKGHYWFIRKDQREPPPIVVEEAKMLIGKRFEDLL